MFYFISVFILCGKQKDVEFRLFEARVKIGYVNGTMILFYISVGLILVVFAKMKMCLIPKQNVCFTVLVTKVKFQFSLNCNSVLVSSSLLILYLDHTTTNFVSESVDHKYDELGSSTLAPIAPSDRGAELTFAETGRYTVFMMAENNAFIQLDGNRIPTFQLRYNLTTLQT